VEEWKDKRNVRSLRAWDYTLTNAHYEATLGIDRDTIEDDKYGLFMPRIQNLAMSARRFYGEKIFSYLDGGTTYAAYDGTAMFSDSRPIGDSGTIDNLMSGAYSGSASEVRTAINAAAALMMNYKDDYGKPMNLMPDTIVCSPAMYITMKEAIRGDYSGAQRTETEFVKEIIPTPWIDADADDWYFLCTTAEVKPLIFQNRKDPEFVPLDDPKDSFVFNNKKFLYGVDARFAVGFGDPRTAIKVVDA
jgi:phage major head subunit gpT-like protein